MNASINIYDLLDRLRLRKAMYLGNGYNFHSLQAFLSGFTLAVHKSQLEQEHTPSFDYFNTWILGHLGITGNTGGWHWHIHQRNPTDDNKAFEEFFDYLDIFKSSIVTARSILLDPEAIQHSIDGPVKRYTGMVIEEQYLQKRPAQLKWTTISNSATVWIEWLDNDQNSITDQWYFNASEANESLQQEFGTFKNDWVQAL